MGPKKILFFCLLPARTYPMIYVETKTMKLSIIIAATVTIGFSVVGNLVQLVGTIQVALDSLGL